MTMQSSKTEKSKKVEKIEKPLKTSEAKYSAIIVDDYPQYNLRAEQILRNGTSTNTQLIIKGDKFYHFSNKYQVLPNEEAMKVAERIQESTGLIWAKDMKKDWKGPLTIPKMMGNYDRAITALLIDPKEINLTKGVAGQKDDWIRKGIGIGSSIDGSSSLKVFGFTFRQICANYAFHKFHLGSLKIDAELNPRAFNDAKISFKQIFIHAGDLNVKSFEESCKEVLKKSNDIIRRYVDMRKEKLTMKHFQNIVLRMPNSILKNSEGVQKWMEWEKKKGFIPIKGAFEKTTVWDAFNDITDELTHNEKLSYKVKMNSFNRLDRILVAPIVS